MIQVSTSEFYFSHGRMPRGFGYWAFRIGASPEPFWAQGSYSEAKAAAIAEARRQSASYISVQP